MVLENVPSISLDHIPDLDVNRPVTIGYFGVLEEKNRGLENLVKACSGRSDVEVKVAGYGQLEDFFTIHAVNESNLTYFGPKTALEGLQIMSQVDIIVGMYYLTVPNHKYAAPNKYFEHLYLGRPLLTTTGTPTGDKVTHAGTGWAIGENVSDISRWLDHLTPEEIENKGTNARQLWNEKYQDYYAQHYEGLYLATVNRLLN